VSGTQIVEMFFDRNGPDISRDSATFSKDRATGPPGEATLVPSLRRHLLGDVPDRRPMDTSPIWRLS
jgi:hypothetical protein